MTPSSITHRLRDVRYFESLEPPALGKSFPSYAGKLFKTPKASTALGQRIGMRCEESGVSIGRASHLYLCFTQSVPPGTLVFTEYSIATWHQFMLCGLESNFNVLPEREKLAIVTGATFKVLETLAPQYAVALQTVRQDIDTLGESLRITVKRKETSKYKLSVEQTVPVHPRAAEVFLRVTQLSTGAERDIKIGEAAFYDQVSSLVDRIAIVRDILTVHPKKSFHAEIVNSMNKPLQHVNLLEQFGVSTH